MHSAIIQAPKPTIGHTAADPVSSNNSWHPTRIFRLKTRRNPPVYEKLQLLHETSRSASRRQNQFQLTASGQFAQFGDLSGRPVTVVRAPGGGNAPPRVQIAPNPAMPAATPSAAGIPPAPGDQAERDRTETKTEIDETRWQCRTPRRAEPDPLWPGSR